MSGLNVVCLISGGKDSIFSILHCIANGHNAVALANLHPPGTEAHAAVDDLDSYMYQTVGHSVIPLYEKALGLPLYRQAILGSAVNQDKCYGSTALDQNDETEALVPLLRNVMAHQPEVNAISTGAILSDYQRTRVESVAIRLGLTPLSYLWQYPFLTPSSQTSLLEDMAAIGQDSRIVKVASGGLDSSFIWENVADPRSIARLDKASKRFGSVDSGAVLGEGGEYETLAICGPAPLWKARIVVDDNQRTTIIGDAGSVSLHVRKAQVEPRHAEIGDIEDLRIPPFLEPPFQTLLYNLSAYGEETQTQTLAWMSNGNLRKSDGTAADGVEDRLDFNLETLGHTTFPNMTGTGSSVADETRSIMDLVKEKLENRGNSYVDVAYTSIILRDMGAFPIVNKIYGSYFEYPNPPARVTIACADVLPPGKQLMVSFTFAKRQNNQPRKGLHVQSRSYWAPANIGPYSQAISVPYESRASSGTSELVYLAGQIPLLPASMELAAMVSSNDGDTFELQTVLSLQHAVRIGRVMRVKQWVGAIAFVVADSPNATTLQSRTAQKAWRAFHQENGSAVDDIDDDNSEDESFDVWDAKYGMGRTHPYETAVSSEETIRKAVLLQIPPLYIIRVDALPRSASIEWVTYGTTEEAGNLCRIPHFDHLLRLFKHNIVAAV